MSITSETDPWGNETWKKDGLMHRDGDLPARICSNGSKMWTNRGKLHRSGLLPALESSDGSWGWYKKGWPFTLLELIKYNTILILFGICILHRIRIRRLKQVRWIHGELLCRPPNGNFPGGQDYHKMVSYFNKL
jgi:hypothetical protein